MSLLFCHITKGINDDNFKYRENRVWLELYGLSTDEKPIEKFDDIFIGNSSTYYEMDTKNTFMYDEENKKWWEV